MSFRGPAAHPNRVEKPPGGVGSEPGDRQDWQRISGKRHRKSMPVLSVPGALVGGDEVTMAVFHELSRAEGPSQQGRKSTLVAHALLRAASSLTRRSAPWAAGVGKSADARCPGRRASSETRRGTQECVRHEGAFSSLLGWAFGPRKFMKNCHGDFIATHERPRD